MWKATHIYLKWDLYVFDERPTTELCGRGRCTRIRVRVCVCVCVYASVCACACACVCRALYRSLFIGKRPAYMWKETKYSEKRPMQAQAREVRPRVFHAALRCSPKPPHPSLPFWRQTKTSARGYSGQICGRRQPCFGLSWRCRDAFWAPCRVLVYVRHALNESSSIAHYVMLNKFSSAFIELYRTHSVRYGAKYVTYTCNTMHRASYNEI